MDIKIAVDAREALLALVGIRTRAEHPRPLLNKIGEYVRGVVSQAFRDQADPETGMGWQPLSPETIKRRRGLGVGVMILDDTSRLRRSIRSMVLGSDRVAVGTDTAYGKYHQHGRGVPKRPFLGIDSRAREAIRTMVAVHVVKGSGS